MNLVILADKQRSYKHISDQFAHIEIFKKTIIRLWRARDEQLTICVVSFVNITFRDEICKTKQKHTKKLKKSLYLFKN